MKWCAILWLVACGDDASNSDASGRDAGRPRDGAPPPRSDGGGGRDAGAVGPTGGCFEPGERPPTVAPGGLRMPSLEDERSTYTAWGFTWDPSAEPDFPSDPTFEVDDPDIHGDTEGDDLWTNLMQYRRTGEMGYLDRATAWARYFKEDYRQCVGSEGASFCYDRDAFGADHLWGWGLIAWFEAMGDAEALAEAERLGEVVEGLWADDSPFGCLPSGGCTHYGVRQIGRHLLFMTRLAEVSAGARWSALRDRMIDTLLESGEWDDRGMYFYGDFGTDGELGEGAWARGDRLASPFQIGVLSEAMDQAYRATGREELRTRMIAMARFVEEYGLDPTYQYTGSSFGIVGGAVYHNYGVEPVTFWDPVYTTALVNTLVRGFRYSCEGHFYEAAKYFFERGNKGLYGEPTMRAAPDGVIDHFVDTRFASATGNFYFDYNKGELQYTYLLFEPVM
jgi:hypothetical protein